MPTALLIFFCPTASRTPEVDSSSTLEFKEAFPFPSPRLVSYQFLSVFLKVSLRVTRWLHLLVNASSISQTVIA